MPPRKKPGRPPRADKAATERLEIRLTKLERAIVAQYAARADLPVSEWIRRRIVVDTSDASLDAIGRTDHDDAYAFAKKLLEGPLGWKSNDDLSLANLCRSYLVLHIKAGPSEVE